MRPTKDPSSILFIPQGEAFIFNKFTPRFDQLVSKGFGGCLGVIIEDNDHACVMHLDSSSRVDDLRKTLGNLLKDPKRACIFYNKTTYVDDYAAQKKMAEDPDRKKINDEFEDHLRSLKRSNFDFKNSKNFLLAYTLIESLGISKTSVELVGSKVETNRGYPDLVINTSNSSLQIDPSSCCNVTAPQNYEERQRLRDQKRHEASQNNCFTSGVIGMEISRAMYEMTDTLNQPEIYSEIHNNNLCYCDSDELFKSALKTSAITKTLDSDKQDIAIRYGLRLSELLRSNLVTKDFGISCLMPEDVASTLGIDESEKQKMSESLKDLSVFASKSLKNPTVSIERKPSSEPQPSMQQRLMRYFTCFTSRNN